jgi:FMN reductase
MREDTRPYLADRAVGLIVTAYGWPAAITTLAGLRVVVHALRGWVTPYGATINALETPPIGLNKDPDPDVVRQLNKVADEVLRFADLMATSDPGESGTEFPSDLLASRTAS